jgi:hypothetical protein
VVAVRDVFKADGAVEHAARLTDAFDAFLATLRDDVDGTDPLGRGRYGPSAIPSG